MTMREKMARSMYDKTAATWVVPQSWDAANEFDKGQFLKLADRCLDALLTPTEGMILAVCAKAKEEQCRPIAVHRRDAADFIEAAIRAAKDGA